MYKLEPEVEAQLRRPCRLCQSKVMRARSVASGMKRGRNRKNRKQSVMKKAEAHSRIMQGSRDCIVYSESRVIAACSLSPLAALA